MGRSEVAAVKRCMSATADHYRPAYGREPETVPRQCVFCGTTNPDATGEYLRERTGNRRFWPVTVKYCNLDGLAENRDQLWAEACVAYTRHEHWWLESDEEVNAANGETVLRLEENPWLDRTARYVTANGEKSEFRTAEIFEIATGCSCILRELERTMFRDVSVFTDDAQRIADLPHFTSELLSNAIEAAGRAVDDVQPSDRFRRWTVLLEAMPVFLCQ
jgi:hypothetical protein